MFLKNSDQSDTGLFPNSSNFSPEKKLLSRDNSPLTCSNCDSQGPDWWHLTSAHCRASGPVRCCSSWHTRPHFSLCSTCPYRWHPGPCSRWHWHLIESRTHDTSPVNLPFHLVSQRCLTTASVITPNQWGGLATEATRTQHVNGWLGSPGRVAEPDSRFVPKALPTGLCNLIS